MQEHLEKILSEVLDINIDLSLLRQNIITFSNRLTELEQKIVDLGVELKFEINSLHNKK